MPKYIYRALTRSGQEVKNRVEDSSRINLIRKLKRNGLIPIAVVQSKMGPSGQRAQRNKKRKMAEAENILRRVDTTNAASKKKRRDYFKRENINVEFFWGRYYNKRCNDIYSKFLLIKKGKF